MSDAANNAEYPHEEVFLGSDILGLDLFQLSFITFVSVSFFLLCVCWPRLGWTNQKLMLYMFLMISNRVLSAHFVTIADCCVGGSLSPRVNTRRNTCVLRGLLTEDCSSFLTNYTVRLPSLTLRVCVCFPNVDGTAFISFCLR